MEIEMGKERERVVEMRKRRRRERKVQRSTVKGSKRAERRERDRKPERCSLIVNVPVTPFT